MTEALFGMLFVLLVATLVASGISYECDLATLPEQLREIGRRVCRLESKMYALEAVDPEMAQRSGLELIMNEEEEPIVEKRKNEFIRFGKRSLNNVKRKNEFIRFGKRKNEFIRFGRSFPSLGSSSPVEKRKNEFIRFG